MFTKTLLYIFIFVGMFTLLFTLIPTGYFTAPLYSTAGVNRAIVERMTLANLTVYANAGNDTMTYPYSSLSDAPGAPQWEAGLPSGHFLEVWWGNDVVQGDTIFINHVQAVWFWYEIRDYFYFTFADTTESDTFLTRADLVTNYDDIVNGTTTIGTCDHTSMSVVWGFNQSDYSNIGEAWDNGELNYYFSYEVDYNRTQISAWTVLGQLLTFQSPALGIPGVAGTVANYMVAAPIWIMVAVLIIKLAQSVIPTIRGVDD